MEPFRFQRTHVKAVSRGFSLLELLVVLGIITVITAITITSQSAFNKTLVLANTAYDFALTVRYAQTYGIGSRAAGTLSNTGYGIHVARGVTDSFIFFADSDPAPGGPGVCHTPPSGDPSAPDAQQLAVPDLPEEA